MTPRASSKCQVTHTQVTLPASKTGQTGLWGRPMRLHPESEQPWGEVKRKGLFTLLCPTLRDSVDSSPTGSSVHGMLQALERVAIPFSRGSSQPRDRIPVSSIAGRFFIVLATREAAREEALEDTARPQRARLGLALLQERLKLASRDLAGSRCAQGCVNALPISGLIKGGPLPQLQWSPAFLAPGMGFVEDSPFTGQGQGMAPACYVY